jgi:YhcH/YjgK/YiaL family protein
MILDILTNSSKYTSLHPGIATALKFLSSPGTTLLAPGRYPIAGDAVFAIIEHCEGGGRENARLEIHRRFIDVQFVVSGNEWMGWSPFSACSLDREGFSTESDIGFCNEPPKSWFEVSPGYFTIFYPSDAHAPLSGNGQVHKIVVKVAVTPGS